MKKVEKAIAKEIKKVQKDDDGFMSSVTMHEVIIDQLSFLPQGALVRLDAV